MVTEKEVPWHRETEFHELLDKARAGSTEALGKVLQAFEVVLLHAARRMLPSELQAKGSPSDLVQDTLLEASQDLHQFHGNGPEDLSAWLHGILRKNFGDLLRSYRSRKKRQIDREVRLDRAARNLQEFLKARSLSPSEEASHREEVEVGRSAYNTLPEHYRYVLWLRYGRQLTFEQIGHRLGCSSDAARKAASRAMRHFADQLGLSPG
jgi:RNA polymerase sigma-70 factor (subfamily 1)